MLVAVNAHNQHVYALDEQKNTHQKFYCPQCNEPVFLKKGLIKQAHFTHFKNSNCAIFSEGETEEHVLGKSLLYQWFTQQDIPCQLEAYLPNLKQRPDLLIWLDEQTPIAIEFQCSALSAQRMIERTSGYNENGYKVYWILGHNYHLKDKITKFQRLFVNEHKALGCYFLELHVNLKKLTIHYQICEDGHSSRIACHYYQFKLTKKETNMKKIIQQLDFPSLNYIVEPKKRLVQEHCFLNKGRNYQVPEIVSFQKHIYKCGDSLISLPLEVYLPVRGQLVIKSLPYFWKYIFLEWIMNKSIGDVITKKDFMNKVKCMIKNEEVVFHLMPLISNKYKIKCLENYMALLNERGILVMVSNSEWIVQRKPTRFKNEKEKIDQLSIFDQLFER